MQPLSFHLTPGSRCWLQREPHPVGADALLSSSLLSKKGANNPPAPTTTNPGGGGPDPPASQQEETQLVVPPLDFPGLTKWHLLASEAQPVPAK